MANDVEDWTNVNLISSQPVPGSPFTVARDGAQHDLGNVSMVAGTKSLLFVWNTPAAIANISAVGATTGIDYANTRPDPSTSLAYVRMVPVVDAVVDVKVTADAAGGNLTLGVAFLLSDQVTDSDLKTPSLLAKSCVRAIGVGAVGTAVLVGPVAGQLVRLYGWGIMVVGQTAGTTNVFLEDGATGNSLAGFSFSGTGSGALEGERDGAPMDAVGNSFRYHVTALGTGASVNIWASTSQG